MKKSSKWLGVFFGFLLIFFGCQPQEKADLVIKNGKVFTVNEESLWTQAVAVKGETILTVGSDEDVEKYIGDSTQVLDVEGKLVIPGLIDSHVHFTSGGQRLAMLRLRGVKSIEEIQEKIAERIKELPEGAPVMAIGSIRSTTLFPGPLGLATKDILDPVSPNNPVVIRRSGGHAVLLNSVALKQSGITKETETPYGGEIVRDPKTGEPTGVLKEAAQRLSKIQIQSTMQEDIERALEYVKPMALTGVVTHADLEKIEVYKKLNEEGKLTLRINATLPYRGIDEYIEKGIKLNQGNNMVRLGLIKIFIDGTLGVRSALLYEDFTEEPGNRGLAQYDEQEFYDMVEKCHVNGYQIGVHAIGDKGVNWVLNAVERAQDKHGKKGLRHRVEHNTLNLIEDTKRFKPLGVIASMQPTISGNPESRKGVLGEERAKRSDIWRTLLENEAMLCWGTDWPVVTLDPMLTIRRMIIRNPEQRLTMEEAIKYYTYGSAYGTFEEDIKGTLEKGKLADIVVLSKDLFAIDPEEIVKTEVEYKILGGKIVYQKGA
ncbi:amidohydrolase [Acidobacteriota bacterium]